MKIQNATKYHICFCKPNNSIMFYMNLGNIGVTMEIILIKKKKDKNSNDINSSLDSVLLISVTLLISFKHPETSIVGCFVLKSSQE